MKKNGIVGFLKGAHFMARMNEIQTIVMLQHAIDSGEYKNAGFENAKDFIRTVTGGSYEAFHERSKKLKQLGSEVVSILVSVGWGIKDVRMIESSIVEDTKTGQKMLKVDEQWQIPFANDRISDLQAGYDKLREQRDAARKEIKRAQEKLEGIDKEHKKEIKAMQKEIEDLRSQVISPDTPESFDEVFRAMERKATEIVILAKRLNFSEAHKDIPDGPIKAKYKVRINALETQFGNLIDALNEAVFEK